MSSKAAATVLSVALLASFTTPAASAGETIEMGDVRLDSSGLSIVGAEVLQAGPMSDDLRSAWEAAYTLAMENRDDFAYPWMDPKSGTIRITLVSDRGRTLAEAREGEFDQTAHVTYADSAVSVTDLDRLGDAVSRLNETGVADASFIWKTEPDHLNNRIIVTTTEATPRLMKALAVQFGTTNLAVRIEPAPLEAGPASRDDDYPSFYGGARIYTPLGSCTTGFGWTAASDKSMVLAGHCALGGGQVSYPSWSNVGSVTASAEENWSKTSGTTFFTGQSVYRGDLSLIRYYSQYATYRAYTGATGSSTNRVVTAYEWSAVGDFVCANGASDGENCGHVSATGVNVHYTTQGPAVQGDNVWLRNAVHVWPSTSNQCPIPGDSGAPVYRHWTADGNVTAKGIYSGTGSSLLTCEWWYTDIMNAYYGLTGTVNTLSN